MSYEVTSGKTIGRDGYFTAAVDPDENFDLYGVEIRNGSGQTVARAMQDAAASGITMLKVPLTEQSRL